MILNVIDRKIRRAFSEAAGHYDVLTALHKEIGRELLAMAVGGSPEAAGPDAVDAVLDVGMGTGWLTGRLKDCFPDACVVGLDAAGGMIETARRLAKGFTIVQADAGCLPFHGGSFDRVVSNLAYQWVGDLSGAWTACHRVLKDGGSLYATVFGHRTFQELFEALAKTRGDGHGLAIVRLAGKGEIAAALNQAGFRDMRVAEETIRAHFPDMMAMVKWIKATGANALMKDVFVGRDWLEKAGAYYDTTFRGRLGVYATFEVIWVEARKEEA